MKYEEMRDICTILVEPTDERAIVWQQVSRQHKPVVIVLPAYTNQPSSQLFQRSEDFGELKRIKRERNIPITLVIAGDERLRNRARRQGFTVYASTETCARALARRDRFKGYQASPASFSCSVSGPLEFFPRHLNETEPIVRLKVQTEPIEKLKQMGETDSLRLRKRPAIDKVLLVLVLLLALGIMGGIGFGYLLLVLHAIV